ncbi:unnamed protein product [Cunninghamella echinulata]
MQPYSSQCNSIPNIKNLSSNNNTSPLYINNQLPPLPISQNNTNLHDTRTKKRTRKDRACDLCRRKKIRCDYNKLFRERPCSSCKGYGVSCTFNEAAKKRGPPKGYVEGLEQRLQRMEELLMTVATSNSIPADTIKQFLNERDDTNNNKVKHEQDIDIINNKQSTSSPPSSSAPLSPTLSSTSTIDNASVTSKKRTISQSLGLKDSHIEDQLDSVKANKYAFIGSSSGVYMLNRLFQCEEKVDGSSDTNCTPTVYGGKGGDVMVARFGHKSSQINFGPGTPDDSVWVLPPKPVVDHLVKLYFLELNLHLPIIDEDEFMEKYNADSENISKPLLLSICRVMIRTIPENDPFLQEYTIDKLELFKQILHQLQSHYHLDFIEPHIECIQILLLASVNADGWCPKSSDWIATSIAIKMAQDLGLHRSNTQVNISPNIVEARKRLWWSAYIVDRWICASLGRPLTINDADCDLEYPNLGENDKYARFIVLIKLSSILGNVLRAICSPRARSMSDDSSRFHQISRQLEQALIDWKHLLPSHLWINNEDVKNIREGNISKDLYKKLNNGAGQLRMLYVPVLLLSKRPFVYLGADSSSSVVVPQDCMDEIATALDIFLTIDFNSLLSGWTLSSYAFTQIFMYMLLNYRNEDPKIVSLAKQQVKLLKQQFHKVENYFCETQLSKFFESVCNIIENDTLVNSKSSQSTSLLGASSGIDWNDILDIFTENFFK